MSAMNGVDTDDRSIHIIKKHKIEDSNSISIPHQYNHIEHENIECIAGHNDNNTDSIHDTISKQLPHSLHHVLRMKHTIQQLELITKHLDRGRTIANGCLVKRSEFTNDKFDSVGILALQSKYTAEVHQYSKLLNNSLESLSRNELTVVYTTVTSLNDIKHIGRLRRELNPMYYSDGNKPTRFTMIQCLYDIHISYRTIYLKQLYKYCDQCLQSQTMVSAHRIESYLTHHTCMQWERCTITVYIDQNKYKLYWHRMNKIKFTNIVHKYWSEQQKHNPSNDHNIIHPTVSADNNTSNNCNSTLDDVDTHNNVMDISLSDSVQLSSSQSTTVRSVYGKLHTIDTSLVSVLNGIIDYTVSSAVRATATDTVQSTIKLKLQRTLASHIFNRAPITPVVYDDGYPCEPVLSYDEIDTSDNEYISSNDTDYISDDDDDENSDENNDIIFHDPIMPSLSKIHKVWHVYIDEILPQNYQLKDQSVIKNLIYNIMPGIDDVQLNTLNEYYTDDAKLITIDTSNESIVPHDGTTMISIDNTTSSSIIKPEPTLSTDDHLPAPQDINSTLQDKQLPTDNTIIDLTDNELIAANNAAVAAIPITDIPVKHMNERVLPYLSSLMTVEQRRIKHIQFTALISYICKSFGLDEVPLSASVTSDRYKHKVKQCGTIANGRIYIAKSVLSSIRENNDDNNNILHDSSISAPCDRVILGLFANRHYKVNDIVCAYGGVKEHGDELIARWKHYMRQPGKLSHARQIPGSEYVRDGRLWSQAFDRTQFINTDDAVIDLRSPVPVDDTDIKQPLSPSTAALHHINVSDSSALYTWDDVKLDEMDSNTNNNNNSNNTRSTLNDDELYARPVQKVYPSYTPLKLLELMYAEFRSGAHTTLLSPHKQTDDVNDRQRRKVTYKLASEGVQMQLALKQSIHEPMCNAVIHYNAFLDDPLYYNALQSMCVKLNNMLLYSGVGYMSNSRRNRRTFNVRSVDYNPSRNKDILLTNELFYIATADIKPHDEILAPYQNNESKLFQY